MRRAGGILALQRGSWAAICFASHLLALPAGSAPSAPCRAAGKIDRTQTAPTLAALAATKKTLTGYSSMTRRRRTGFWLEFMLVFRDTGDPVQMAPSRIAPFSLAELRTKPTHAPGRVGGSKMLLRDGFLS